MKKLICLLLAAVLCLSVAAADSVTCGGYKMNVPENWRVAVRQEDGDMAYLKLQEVTDAPVNSIYVSSSNLRNWESFTADEQTALNNLALMARIFAISDKAVGEEYLLTGYMPLRDGGMAWRGAYETQSGDTYGRLIMLHEGRNTIAYITAKDGDQQQYLKLMDEMVRPLRVAQVVEAGGLRLALPAGWERHEGKENVFFSLSEASGNMAMFYTLDVAAQDIKAAVDAGQLNELLIQAARTVFSGYEFSDVRAETVDLQGIPGIIAGLNVKIDGTAVGMGVLSALVENKLVCGMVITATGAAQDGLEWMKVMLHPMTESRLMEVSGQTILAYPQEFVNENSDVAEDGTIIAELVDQPLSFATYFVSPASEQAAAQDAWSYLESVLGYSSTERIHYANGAKGMLLSLEMESQVVEAAYAEAALLHENRLIQVTVCLVDGKKEDARALAESLLFEKAEPDALQVGKLTIHVPSGLTMQQVEQEDVQLVMQANDDERSMYVVITDASENMKDTIASLGEQVGLEAYLALWVNNSCGVEGVTVEYTPEHQGMAMARTSFEYSGAAVGYAYLLDGDMLYAVSVVDSNTEVDGMKLLNAVLDYTE